MNSLLSMTALGKEIRDLLVDIGKDQKTMVRKAIVDESRRMGRLDNELLGYPFKIVRQPQSESNDDGDVRICIRLKHSCHCDTLCDSETLERAIVHQFNIRHDDPDDNTVKAVSIDKLLTHGGGAIEIGLEGEFMTLFDIMDECVAIVQFMGHSTQCIDLIETRLDAFCKLDGHS